jgi:hypothetical protein
MGCSSSSSNPNVATENPSKHDDGGQDGVVTTHEQKKKRVTFLFKVLSSFSLSFRNTESAKWDERRGPTKATCEIIKAGLLANPYVKNELELRGAKVKDIEDLVAAMKLFEFKQHREIYVVGERSSREYPP